MTRRDTTLAYVEDELAALRSYAGRHGWLAEWNRENLALDLVGPHPADAKPIRLHGDLTDYRDVPPAWSFVALDPSDANTKRIPTPGTLPEGKSSIFHASGVICAPFNRLAYTEHRGPHGDWGGPAKWTSVKASGQVVAHTLEEMMIQFLIHLQSSPNCHS